MHRNAVQHSVRCKAGGSRSYDIDEDVMSAECLRQREQKRSGRIA